MLAYPVLEIRKEAVAALKSALLEMGAAFSDEEVERSLSEPKPEFGDLSTRISFVAAPKLKRAPTDIASEMITKIRAGGFFARIEAAVGYVNFFVDYKVFGPAVIEAALRMKDKYGSSDYGRGKKVLVEHTGVNPNKPWHIGHARNAVLGDCTARLLKTVGYAVEVQNYINDLGRQVAISVLDYMWGARPKKKEKFDQWLGRHYVEISKKLEERPKLEDEVSGVLKQLEAGGNKVSTVGRKMAYDCLGAQLITAARMGITYDLLVWESDIVGAGIFDEGISRLKSAATSYIKKSDSGEHKGCVIMRIDEFIKGFRTPEKVLIRSDGTATYTAKDIAYHMWKFGLLKKNMRYKNFGKQKVGGVLWTSDPKGKATKKFGRGDAIINFIDVRQSYPQEIVKIALRLLGFEKQAANYRHVGYEVVRLPEEEFSGRKGTWIGYSADEVLDEAVKKAKEAVAEVRKVRKMQAQKLSAADMKKIAEAVGIGSVRYALEKTGPENIIVFRWKDVLDFEGNTGAYLQYANTRISSIFRKAAAQKTRPSKRPNLAALTLPEEKALVSAISKMPLKLIEAADSLRISVLAEYAYDIANLLSKFYEAAPVLKADGETRAARLALLAAVQTTLSNVLDILGIPVIERM